MSDNVVDLVEYREKKQRAQLVDRAAVVLSKARSGLLRDALIATAIGIAVMGIISRKRFP